MTISLEEHVARAICEAQDLRWEDQKSFSTSAGGNEDETEFFLHAARAAIAAVREPAPDPAEAMRAKCFDFVAVEMEAWREAGHTDDGDLYAQAIAALGVLKPISERIAALKGNGEGP